jgi:hypothetical protein
MNDKKLVTGKELSLGVGLNTLYTNYRSSYGKIVGANI